MKKRNRLKKKNKLNIRNVNPKDVDLLFKWSNDDLVRAQSFSSEKIPYESHCNWFKTKLEDTSSFLFIIEINNIPASIIRFDEKEREAVIGISIDKNFRGKGLGAKFIKIGVEEFFKTSELVVLASIKKENIASVKSFKKAGFSFVQEEEVNGIESFIYKIEK